MSHKTHHYSDGKVVSQNVKENADTIASSLVNDPFYGTVVSDDFDQTRKAVALAIVLCSMFLILVGFLLFKTSIIGFVSYLVMSILLIGFFGIKGIFMTGIVAWLFLHFIGLLSVPIFG